MVHRVLKLCYSVVLTESRSTPSDQSEVSRLHHLTSSLYLRPNTLHRQLSKNCLHGLFRPQHSHHLITYYQHRFPAFKVPNAHRFPPLQQQNRSLPPFRNLSKAIYLTEFLLRTDRTVLRNIRNMRALPLFPKVILLTQQPPSPRSALGVNLNMEDQTKSTYFHTFHTKQHHNQYTRQLVPRSVRDAPSSCA